MPEILKFRAVFQICDLQNHAIEIVLLSYTTQEIKGNASWKDLYRLRLYFFIAAFFARTVAQIHTHLSPISLPIHILSSPHTPQ